MQPKEPQKPLPSPFKKDTPPGDQSYGSAEVTAKVAAYSKKPEAVDVFTGKKVCHRFFGSMQYQEPNKLNPQQIDLKSVIANTLCIGDKCSLWDHEDKRCLDASERLAQKETARALDYLAGANALSASVAGNGLIE